MATRTRDTLVLQIKRCISHLDSAGLASAQMMILYGENYPEEYKRCEVLRDGIKAIYEYALEVQKVT